MMNRNRLVIAAVLLAVAQIGFLSWIIAARASVLRNGAEVLLKVLPIDPRDFLRGDYVLLSYDISNIAGSLISNAPKDENVTREGDMFVRLGKDADGFWRARSASLYEPFAAPPAAGEVDIRGHIPEGWSLEPTSSIIVDYGIERYYVPEGEGMAIQGDMRERPFGILAAVGNGGGAQIKALMDGDKKLYEEPLY